MRKASKLTEKERDQIAVWYAQEKSLRQIATLLNRDVSSISREIKRNRFQGYCVAIHAQQQTEKRKSQAGKRTPLKNQQVYAYVLKRLRWGWSPEQIAGRLKKRHARTIICPETIYRFVYSSENRDKRLWEYLAWKRKKRSKQYGRTPHRSHIPDRVSIHLRPEEINSRYEFGHWEGDTVEGKGRRVSIHTEVERVSRFMAAERITAITSEETSQAQHKMFKKLPKVARRSTTLDNGKENHQHRKLQSLSMATYFADPYSSWQRGTNEHHNGLLRRYLPKGTSFDQLTQPELDDMITEINSRPRKVLQFQTPLEVFNQQLSVAIQL